MALPRREASVAVPLNIRHITSDIAYVVEHSGMKTIIAEGAYVGLVKDLPVDKDLRVPARSGHPRTATKS